jgi:hypothetical protein
MGARLRRRQALPARADQSDQVAETWGSLNGCPARSSQPLSCAVARNEFEFGEFLDRWADVKKSDGTLERLHRLPAGRFSSTFWIETVAKSSACQYINYPVRCRGATYSEDLRQEGHCRAPANSRR